jgi:alginate O-acetyltransferase complex protein AlgJ
VKPGAVPRLDPAHQEFYALLAKEGVKVIDLTGDFLAHRADDKAPALYCKQDTHWSGEACAVAAKRLANELKDRPWLTGAKRQAFESETRAVEITGDLWGALKTAPPPKEKISLRFVGTRKDGKLEPVPNDPASPILLLGDSHNLIFSAGEDMLATGAGLPAQLALELGVPIDVVAVRGSGATPARENLLRAARAKPDYLKGKKVVVWCLGAREFTESTGWQKVPVVR